MSSLLDFPNIVTFFLHDFAGVQVKKHEVAKSLPAIPDLKSKAIKTETQCLLKVKLSVSTANIQPLITCSRHEVR